MLESHDLRAVGDFEIGAFEEVGGIVVSVCVSVFQKTPQTEQQSVALKLTLDPELGDSGKRTHRKRAATVCHVGRHEFDPAALKVVPEWPLVYWWDERMLSDYQKYPLIESVSPGRVGLTSSNGVRFTRMVWDAAPDSKKRYRPFLNGAEGRVWVEPWRQVVNWENHGLEVKSYTGFLYGSHTRQVRSESMYFKGGVAFAMIGSQFSGRVHRHKSIFGDKGSSIFPSDPENAVCLMNSSRAREILSGLNPSVSFQVGDVNRLPLYPIENSRQIYRAVESAFTTHESHREPSVEFKHPGPSPWRHAQDWAQFAVDRPEGEPLPENIEELDPEPPTDHVSFALGVVLGRFGPNQEGILDPTTVDLSHAVPAGICFLDGTLTTDDSRDSLGHPAAMPLHDAWKTHGPAIDANRDLRTWLRLKFFGDVHKDMYEKRPIHWPLCSANKTFVAWVNIHRMNEGTLRVLHADHLAPALKRLEGELEDLRAAKDGADGKAAREAEKGFDAVLKAKKELADFIGTVTQCSDEGAPPTDPNPKKCPPRETDARYAPDLDDGVMINAAGIWPLLHPLWTQPKTWWTELSLAKSGSKDYDWSHLAMRYWPTRVDKKCQNDPSLGVAHGCFWKYHPARAWAWELRLQDEIGPDFRIQEESYRGDGGDAAHRATYLSDHAEEALAAAEKEALRRRGRGKDAKPVAEMTLLEPGLWSVLPEQCWALEDRIIAKQEAPFRLHAPDEVDARAAFEAKDSGKNSERRNLEAKFGGRTLFEGVST